MELHTIRDLAITKDIDGHEDEVDMPGKGSAVLHQQVTQPVDEGHLRLAARHKLTLAVWKQRRGRQGREWADAIEITQWNDPIALNLTSTNRVHDIEPGRS
jgi:hypothetical protein